ncbi:pancreatic triacylglycerol lipase-like [Thrips palmi]|uniref:Pancreatic triacylglycerol lipase-like n=1 Tax=Thrips palmi TaxID=161013 RepID=A0A6P8Z3F0_THRPL|nr:pancreatic triacylglycerol lipase-like [Thrips palmi]
MISVSMATAALLLLSMFGASAGAGAGSLAWSSGLLNSLYSPVLDPGGSLGGNLAVPRSSLSPPPLSASFSPSFSFTSPPLPGGFASRSSSFATSAGSDAPVFASRSSSFATSAGSDAPGFAASGTSSPSFSGFATGFTSPGYSLRTEPSALYTGGFSSPGSRTKALRTPSAALGISTSHVAAIAENAGRFFARTFRAFSGNPAETVKFDLFTRQQANTPVRVYARKKNTLEQTSFDPSKPTKIIIHGFLSHQGPSSGGDVLKNAFLAVQDCNVITVDWSGADPREYSSAVKLAVPRVANEVAELIRMIHGLGGDLNDVHVLGHSLGAQMAGMAASLTLGPAGAGRVTGLDPAGPLFEGRDPSQRLDPTDAAFVDVVHTDGGQLGYSAPLGHADFFPDSGKHPQPGCGKDVVGLCSHCLVYDLMIDAILRPGSDVYRSCSSWQSYKNGECGQGDNAVMGIYTDPRSRGSYFLATNRSVRPELRTAGDKDLVGIFTLRNNPQKLDGVMLLHC